VRVPDEAVIGKAKVTLTFPDWKDGKVAPLTIEVPIVPASPTVDLGKIDRTIALA
jgi:hypothetical protein